MVTAGIFNNTKFDRRGLFKMIGTLIFDSLKQRDGKFPPMELLLKLANVIKWWILIVK